jgi:hypothetical protein
VYRSFEEAWNQPASGLEQCLAELNRRINSVPNIVRMPINNVLMNGDYTGTIVIGSLGVKANVLLDTGSGILAVSNQIYDPARDSSAQTTKLAQEVKYGSGSWVGAVVRTAVAVSPEVRLGGVNLAVTYHSSPDIFGQADGIFGLAYQTLDRAWLMSGDTWQAKYDADQVSLGQASDLDPYFSQMAAAGVVANVFAFYTKRSTVSMATDDPQSDPLNQGEFVIGGGRQCTDLYTGGFTSVAVLDDQHYRTNLLSVQAGDQPPIPVPPAGADVSSPGNSVVDSGTNSIVLPQSVYDALTRSFGQLNPDFATTLTKFSMGTGDTTSQSQIDLRAWPDLKLSLQGADGSPVTLAVSPRDYWQFDAPDKGQAVSTIYGDGGSLRGQSILGLPLFNGYFTIFDRSAAGGRGVIEFATRT